MKELFLMFFVSIILIATIRLIIIFHIPIGDVILIGLLSYVLTLLCNGLMDRFLPPLEIDENVDKKN